MLINNCFAVAPGYLNLNGQEIVEVPENTDCVYILPDGSWNESAQHSTILAQCRNVGVVYESEMGVLQEEYRWEPGDCLLLCVHKELDAEAVADRAKEIFGIGELQEISREEQGNVIMIFFSGHP